MPYGSELKFNNQFSNVVGESGLKACLQLQSNIISKQM